MNIARLLITMDCERNCDGCCNTYKSLMRQAKHITDLSVIDYCDIVCITGGEPMLYPDLIIDTIKELQQRVALRTYYLYTALFDERIKEIIPLVDGIHYTVHHPLGLEDKWGFYHFEDAITETSHEKSYRVYIDHRIGERLFITPNLYRRLEIKPWLKEGECPLPRDEELYILNE
jgi:organic radical activating enzyme